MSRFLGEIRQNGYVVRDIEKSMRHFAEVIGIGPFLYIEDAPFEGFQYRGVPSEARASLAFAHAGPLQIELIQPLNEAPSLYADFLRAGREGLHHLGYLVDDYEAAVEAGLARGWRVGQRGSLQGVGFTYFDTETHPGTIVEVIEGSAAARGFYAMLEERCRSWDGNDPIQRVEG